MINYSLPEYKNLYKEILIDYNYRFPKFQSIPYSLLRKDMEQTKKNLRQSL